MKSKARIAKITEWFTAKQVKIMQWLILLEKKLPAPVQAGWNVLKQSFLFFRSHSTGTLGAGLSYYMIFSIAPIMVIIVAITSAILGPDAVTGGLKQQIEGVLGSSVAQQLQDMVKSAYLPEKSWLATTLSIFLLLFGSIGVFNELRNSLNVIWDVPPSAEKKFLTYITSRLFSFGMLACIAFLMLVALVLQTGLATFSAYLTNLMPTVSKILFGILEFILSFVLSTVLFAFIYKFMSDVKIKLSLVWPGAIFTACLFAVGKYLISIYISTTNIANTFGVASSVIVLLIWIFYSSQIVFFGAEFTRALALQRGIKLVPSSGKSA